MRLTAKIPHTQAEVTPRVHEYIPALLGGTMIGLAAVMLMATQGSILGVSGILSQLLPPKSKDADWRISFVFGVLVGPVLTMLVTSYRPTVDITNNLPLLIIGGLLVGVGTVLGNGCTSGHGVCGLSRLSTRSLIATTVFMITAIITVWVKHSVTGA
ncbi:MAG: putative membrane protein YedE/YeeE [Granulosicoccus sp.]|jgi:uncharacterized membrane protein YedE/YeeE